MSLRNSYNSLLVRIGKPSSTFDPRIGYPTRILLHSNDMAELAQPLYINTLHNVYVVEELIQFTVG